MDWITAGKHIQTISCSPLDLPADDNVFCHFHFQVCLVFLPGLISGRLFDLGIFKLPFVAASALLVTSTFLVAECTQYWQFVLCQGLATGVSVSIMICRRSFSLPFASPHSFYPHHLPTPAWCRHGVRSFSQCSWSLVQTETGSRDGFDHPRIFCWRNSFPYCHENVDSSRWVSAVLLSHSCPPMSIFC